MAAESKGRQRYVVVGGGVAGVSCAEELARLSPESQVTVVSDSPLIKAATNVVQQSRVLETFDVEQKQGSYLEQRYGNVTVLAAHVTSLIHKEKVVETSDGRRIPYDKVCICTGAKPKLIAEGHPRVIGIRDTESVEDFQRKLEDARRIVVVGNGGIATELVYEVKGCQVVWVIRHTAICHTFVDEGAAVFFLPHLHDDSGCHGDTAELRKRTKYVCEGVGEGREERGEGEKERIGSALGPDWHTGRQMKGRNEGPTHVQVEYEVEVKEILTASQVKSRGLQPSKIGPRPPEEPQLGYQWPIFVALTNGKVFGCDLVVSATGVFPNTTCLTSSAGQTESSARKGVWL
ncbi:Pyridine nucleotide-disulfide oxidoreductase domain-containing protein 1 [Geodia barretti]|uniref:Pyridine nucleotide-disulfide oxidoreductase domain-containing protein 1 n=1 Tax=Geodia barretti TaxID=519541 RepID=A0AA35QV85_GEOBA|nr:Pyridine nucleotide-disulfide oxidoreductase domain-containing protein 1 [Geodia barretti]